MAHRSQDVSGRRRQGLLRQQEVDRGGEAFTVVVRACQPVPSPVYDTYWRFAHERQAVFFQRLELLPPPWTDDPILRAHRFTNAYRASDRVSQYLIRNVIYADGYCDPDDVLFRVLVFKFFNRVDTWELLDRAVGGVRWSTYSFDVYDDVLTRATAAGRRIYSAAYIMPACTAMGDGRKHRGHLRLIESMVRGGLSRRLADAAGMAEAFRLLRSYPMLGDFLAYQYLIDLNYSKLTGYSEDEFVVPGPGARDGLRKVFADPGGYDEADLIRWVAARQEAEFERLDLPFQSLWGRRLHLIDCQNLFCEVDKYSRVKHPEVAGLSGRTRIKQKYVAAESVLPPPWYPPKWKINHLIGDAGRPRPATAAPVSLGLFPE